MKALIIAFFLMAAAAFAGNIARIEAWDNPLEVRARHNIEAFAGETVIIRPKLLSYSAAVNLTGASNVVMTYNAVGSTNTHTVTGSVYSATNGQIEVVWPLAPATNARVYSYSVLISSGTTWAVVAAFGEIKLQSLNP